MEELIARFVEPELVETAALAAWALTALIVLFVAYLLVRAISRASRSQSPKSRQSRLAVMDVAVIGERRLVLIRRDDVEHLVMIGGPSDVVVEQNIVRNRKERPLRPGPEMMQARADEQAAGAVVRQREPDLEVGEIDTPPVAPAAAGAALTAATAVTASHADGQPSADFDSTLPRRSAADRMQASGTQTPESPETEAAPRPASFAEAKAARDAASERPRQAPEVEVRAETGAGATAGPAPEISVLNGSGEHRQSRAPRNAIEEMDRLIEEMNTSSR